MQPMGPGSEAGILWHRPDWSSTARWDRLPLLQAIMTSMMSPSCCRFISDISYLIRKQLTETVSNSLSFLNLQSQIILLSSDIEV